MSFVVCRVVCLFGFRLILLFTLVLAFRGYLLFPFLLLRFGFGIARSLRDLFQDLIFFGGGYNGG